ncbi:hypothetical protein GH714_032443 [Hevea brasiliensis]|uniref:Thioredoxin domain-containing protein n=1 Tax=Hevea brasiliensis TaxID=3981 RepID=A0A6A6N5Q3_HEVBR|nr:hypothetical protein GH714_032443 [Hevea brasiliensis]
MENPKVQEIIEKQVLTVAKAVEDKLDEEIAALERLDVDDLEALRERRIQQMKKMAEKRSRWISVGHGEYSEIPSEKDFFSVVKASDHVVCHFYRENWPCKVGFDELGGTDEFSTEDLEDRLAKAQVVSFECSYIDRMRPRILRASDNNPVAVCNPVTVEFINHPEAKMVEDPDGYKEFWKFLIYTRRSSLKLGWSVYGDTKLEFTRSPEFTRRPKHQCLKVVGIVGYREYDNHDKLVMHLAEYATSLEKIIIDPRSYQCSEVSRNHAQRLQSRLPPSVELEILQSNCFRI